MIIILVVALAMISVVAYWKISTDGDSNTYSRCTNSQTNQPVYKKSMCGLDTCTYTFYDANGKELETTPDLGPGSPTLYDIKTQTSNCTNISKWSFDRAIY